MDYHHGNGTQSIFYGRADVLFVSIHGDPISTFALQSHDYYGLGAQLNRLDLPTVFILEGGYAAKELGVNAANVLDGFEQD